MIGHGGAGEIIQRGRASLRLLYPLPLLFEFLPALLLAAVALECLPVRSRARGRSQRDGARARRLSPRTCALGASRRPWARGSRCAPARRCRLPLRPRSLRRRGEEGPSIRPPRRPRSPPRDINAPKTSDAGPKCSSTHFPHAWKPSLLTALPSRKLDLVVPSGKLFKIDSKLSAPAGTESGFSALSSVTGACLPSALRKRCWVIKVRNWSERARSAVGSSVTGTRRARARTRRSRARCSGGPSRAC